MFSYPVITLVYGLFLFRGIQGIALPNGNNFISSSYGSHHVSNRRLKARQPEPASIGSLMPVYYRNNSARPAAARPSWCQDIDGKKCCLDPNAQPRTVPTCLWSLLGTNGTKLADVLTGIGYKTGSNWPVALYSVSVFNYYDFTLIFIHLSL